MRKARPPKERFDEKWTGEPNSGCWLWLGAIRSKGYGSFRHGDMVQAHRASWELHNGPICGSLQVLHKCDTRLCVNPQHLFLGTHQDNMDDMALKGRQPWPHRGLRPRPQLGLRDRYCETSPAWRDLLKQLAHEAST